MDVEPVQGESLLDKKKWEEEALVWYEKAAHANQPDALYNLALLHLEVNTLPSPPPPAYRGESVHCSGCIAFTMFDDVVRVVANCSSVSKTILSQLLNLGAFMLRPLSLPYELTSTRFMSSGQVDSNARRQRLRIPKP